MPQPVALILFLAVSFVTVTASLPDKQDNKYGLHARGVPSTRKRATSSSCSGEISINSQSDLDNGALGSCTSWTGDIILDDASGNISFPVAINPLASVDGSVYCRNNSGLQSLDLYGITTITGSLGVQNAQTLVYLLAEQLEHVQSVELTSVPQLRGLDISAATLIPSIEIGGSGPIAWGTAGVGQVGTGFDSLESVGTLYIHDCYNISIGPTRLQNVTEWLHVEDSTWDLGFTLDIAWANNITLRNVQNVNLDFMVAVNESFEISDSPLTGIGLESLRFIGGSLYVQNNPDIEAVTINGVGTIGESLIITNNSLLKAPAVGASLQSVGSMDLSGAFVSMEIVNQSFSALRNVSDGITLIFSNETDHVTPVECSWSATAVPYKALQGQWSSFMTCNGTVPSSGVSIRAKAGVGVKFSIMTAVIYWILFYWISEV